MGRIEGKRQRARKHRSGGDGRRWEGKEGASGKRRGREGMKGGKIREVGGGERRR